MITQLSSDLYILECDICGESANEEFDSFYDAVEWKKDKSNGWKSQKRNPKVENSWEDICPECQGE